MGLFHLESHIDASGPIFEGRADGIVDRALEDIIDELADEGTTRIRTYLPTQYMYLGHHGGTPETNPIPRNAGYLQAMIHSYRAAPEVRVITDDPVTYGPWIEGVSPGNLEVWKHRRNPPPRRFPGYHAFRKIAQQLDAEAETIAEDRIRPYIGELNG